jgi:hypothetical protein
MSPRSRANADAVDGRTQNEVLVEGRGHYLNSQVELAGGVLELIRTFRDRLDDALSLTATP